MLPPPRAPAAAGRRAAAASAVARARARPGPRSPSFIFHAALAVAALGCCGLAGAFFILPHAGGRSYCSRRPFVRQQQREQLGPAWIHEGPSRSARSSTALPLSLTYPVLEEEEDEAEGGAMQGPEYTEEDRRHMRRALELAAKALGKTRPNPAVGCVVLDSAGQVVGEGFHPKAGEPHAEVFALREAGERARGGTAYVTLEPCNHHGRTPPCVDALLAAGVKRVVAGMVDPFPLVGGKGLARLAEGGVEVVVGCEEERCRDMNRPFLHRVRHGLPLGFLPLAYSDHAFQRPGREVLRLGEGPKVLRMADAAVVMVMPQQQQQQQQGRQDAAADGDDADAGAGCRRGLAALEELEAAGDLSESVVRVVATPDLAALPLEHPLWARTQVRRVVLTAPSAEQSASAAVQAALTGLKAAGVEVVESGAGPLEVGRQLQELGMLSALWLAGAQGAAACVRAGVVHELWVHAALKDADELDGVGTEGGELDWAAGRFGRPMRVSVMSCDALGSRPACVLTLQVDEEEGEGEDGDGGKA